MAAGGAPIGTGKEAEVFVHEDGVLKLYRSGASKASAFREAAILARLESSGLRIPKVSAVGRFGGRWGLVMSRASGPTFADALTATPGRTEVLVEAMAALHRQVHACAGAGLGSLKARLAADIARAPGLGARRPWLDALAAMPDGDRLCHGDFHPWNILGGPEGATIVDWLDAGSGPPAADLCRSWLLMRPRVPDVAEAYLAAYLARAPFGRDAVMAWLPFVAAARLAEGVGSERADLVALARLPGATDPRFGAT